MQMKQLRETDENVVILAGARVCGDVTFGEECSVWFNAVIRGDGAPISLGSRCNVQDNAVLHSELGAPLVIGNDVTIGHSAVVHCREVGDGTVIGMGAVLVQGAVIGKYCVVGAGAVVTGKTHAPDGALLVGNPAKVVRMLSEDEQKSNLTNALHYVELKELYR